MCPKYLNLWKTHGLPRKCSKCSPTTVAEVKKMATMTDEKKSMTELEGWIEQLMECKQLSENQVHVQDLLSESNKFVKYVLLACYQVPV